MSQETVVVRVAPEEQRALRERLGAGQFDFRRVPHARFSVKGEGVVATLYNSGKLVVQGADPGHFLARYGLASGVPAPAAPKAEASAAAPVGDRTTVGSDETGKGDYFGPLVVCAVRLEPEQARALRDAGVMDSKRLTDPRALRLGAMLREETTHALEVLSPPDYNREWQELGLHSLLSRQHAAAIRAVARAGDRVVIDQFAKRDEIGPALADLELDIEQRPRAESEVAVAAASILARAEFLNCLRELGEEYGVPLHKGAGAPVDAAGAAFARNHGMDKLAEVAKLHFKNTDKVRARLGRR